LHGRVQQRERQFESGTSALDGALISDPPDGPRAVRASRRPVIAGLGLTEIGAVYGFTPAQLAAQAIRRAMADAGLVARDVDGLLVSSGLRGGVGLDVHRAVGMKNLRLMSEMQSFGATAGAMVQVASMAIMSGMAETVVCVFADAPRQAGRASGAVYGGEGRVLTGWKGLQFANGLNANALYALAARRHMLRFGTTSEQFGHIAVAQRQWAALNPLAQMRDPITLADHQESRFVAEPFHLLDCCLVSNGGIAVVVTSAERSESTAQQPVHVLGWAQAHPGSFMQKDDDFGITTGAARAGRAALAMAGVTIDDVDIAELYDCYTFTVLITLEDYGFCAKGEGGPFVASGVLGPKGTLAVNTGGGQLSGYYLWGMTPLSEAIMQARGKAEGRQLDKHDVILVSGNGGILDHHSTLVLGSNPS
jgi:acetyl-CoA acetyltransferase